MQNGQSKVKTNGVSGPAKAAPANGAAAKSPPPSPFTFVDELPAKIRSLVQGAVEAAKADTSRAGDRRYLDGMRRGAYLITLALASLDGPAKMKVAEALDQLESELDAEEKKLRDARPSATK